jgi:uncharacterized membrane protein
MKNKFKIIITSIIVLLPILVGVAYWDELPEQIATHWGPSGEPDGWSSKAVAVFLLPLFLVVIHMICIFATSSDKKNRYQNPKLMSITYWITPLISLVVNGMTYANALGSDIEVIRILPIIFGVIFLFIGNYLPKCTQNRTVGIRIKWTLESEENWNATHRFGGKVLVIGAIVLLATVLAPAEILAWLMIGIVLAMAAVPLIYSYCFSRKKSKKE